MHSLFHYAQETLINYVMGITQICLNLNDTHNTT
jgi:hypothetical protein